MTREELQTKYKTLSKSELLEIIERKFDYTELAVTVALSELATRSITENDIKTYKEEKVQKAVTNIRKNILEDLSFGEKNLFFFLWLPLINFPFKQNYRDGEYALKLKQANYYSLFGFLFLMLLIILSVNYDLSNLTTFVLWMLAFLPVYAFDESVNRAAQIRMLNSMYEQQKEEEENPTAQN